MDLVYIAHFDLVDLGRARDSASLTSSQVILSLGSRKPL